MKPVSDITVLFVDDEPEVLNSLRRFLRKEPYRSLFADSGRSAMEILTSHPVDIIVSDLRMPEMDGLALIRRVKAEFPEVIRLILSATRDVEQTIEAINSGEVFRFILKPLDPQPFKQIIYDAVDFYRLKTEREELLLALSRSNQELKQRHDELRSMAEELRASEEKFRSMAEAAHDAVIMVDDHDQIVFWNKAAEKIFGYSRNEVMGWKPYEKLAPSRHRDRYRRALDEQRRIADGRMAGVIKGLRRDGSEFFMELSMARVQIWNAWHVVGVARDATAQVEAEKAQARYENMQKEFEAQIEKRLLQTQAPQSLPRADLASVMIPAGHLAGDFADFIVYDDRHVDILLGDVIGKGVQSALIAAGLQHLFAKSLARCGCGVTPRMSCMKVPHDLDKLSQVIAEVHAMCIQDLLDLNIFATLCYARLDLDAGKMALVDCGHTPTIHFRAETGSYTFLKNKNLPLGLAEEQQYRVTTVPLNLGDVILFYSDGVMEAQSSEGEQFGAERLAEVVREFHYLTSSDLTEKIRGRVATFCNNDQFTDDFSCIAVRIKS
jgi:sigma-B regulation protein RsbU (phosphoserine phosphatase)